MRRASPRAAEAASAGRLEWRGAGDLVGGGRRLAGDQAGVGAVAGHELVVAADLDDAAVVEDDDAVGVADGAEAVGDDEGGAALLQLLQRLLDEVLALAVERRGGLVEDEDAGVAEDGAGDRDALALAAAELDAALADDGVVGVGEFADKPVGVGGPGGGLDLGVAGVGAAVADVVGDAGGEEDRLLRDHADLLAQPGTWGAITPNASQLADITKAAKVIEPIAVPLAKPAPLMLQGKPLPSPKPQASAVIPQPVLSAPPSIPPPKLPPKEAPRASEPPIHKQMERRIRELIHKFDVPALVDALAAAGYREDQIEFVSNPVLTHRASLVEDIEFFRDPPRVLVLTNYGLLGGQGPIPSYFFELLSEQRDSTMTEFLWFFDNALLRQRYAGLFPERDRDIIADFAEVKQLQLALLQLGAPIGMHWLFRLVYPELPVAVRRSIQKRRVRTDGVRMGDAELGSGCAFGGFTQVPVGGIDVRLLCEEWNTPTGQPWAHAAEQRLQRLIIPSLESSDVYLTVTLIFLDRQSFAKLAPQTYLGYDPIAAPPSDDGPPPVQQVILFQGETGRSPH